MVKNSLLADSEYLIRQPTCKFIIFSIKKTHTCVCEFLLVETAGIEPATSCMSSMHSNQLSYASKAYILYHICFGIAIGFEKYFL